MIVLFVAFTLFGWSGAAYASAESAVAPAPPGRADLLAERLARDPIQVTDHVPRELPPGTADRIRAQVARLKVPVYFVVEPWRMPEGYDSRELIPQLHDRLGKDGIYVVVGSNGYGEAQQFGGSLPAARAWTVATLEMPLHADLADQVQRFVEILSAPDVAQRIERRRPRPEDPPSASDVRNRKEMTAFGIASAATGLPILAILLAMRKRADTRKRAHTRKRTHTRKRAHTRKRKAAKG